MGPAIQNLNQSLIDHPRDVILVYHNPILCDLVEAASHLKVYSRGSYLKKLLCRFSERRFVDWDRRDKGRNTLSFSVTSFSHSEHAAIGKRELFRVENVDLKLCV